MRVDGRGMDRARRSSSYANNNNDTTTTTVLDASLVGAGVGALVLTGSIPRLMGRAMARLPDAWPNACLAGVALGALTSGGLWVARQQDRSQRTWEHFLFPWMAHR